MNWETVLGTMAGLIGGIAIALWMFAGVSCRHEAATTYTYQHCEEGYGCR